MHEDYLINVSFLPFSLDQSILNNSHLVMLQRCRPTQSHDFHPAVLLSWLARLQLGYYAMVVCSTVVMQVTHMRVNVR